MATKNKTKKAEAAPAKGGVKPVAPAAVPPRQATREETAALAATPIVLPPSAAEQRALREAEETNRRNAAEAEKNAEESKAAVETRVKETAEVASRILEQEDSVFIDSDHETTKEVSVGGISYYLKPGANEIKPQTPGHTAKQVAEQIISSMSFVHMRVESKKPRAAASKQEPSDADKKLAAFSGIPVGTIGGLAGVENPPARERAQPVLPPNDTEHYSKETLDHLKEAWLEGQGADAGQEIPSTPGGVSSKPVARLRASSRVKAEEGKSPAPAKPVKPAKRAGAVRRLAEEK